MSTNVITIVAIISIFYMDCGVQRAFKNLKKKNERKLVILREKHQIPKTLTFRSYEALEELPKDNKCKWILEK